MPSITQIENELKREKYKARYNWAVKSTIYVLIIVSAIAILISTLWLPVLKIYGTSMEPTFEPGDIVVAVKQKKFKVGDIVAFYYENRLLVKRYIAGPGDWVDIKEDGTVTVNGYVIEESYLTEKSLEPCDIELPYQVPDGKYFVMGDKRSVSIDSRSSSIGCVSKEQLVGHIIFKFLPFNDFGKI